MFPEHRIVKEHSLTMDCSLDKYFFDVVLKQAQMPEEENIIEQCCDHIPKPLDVVLGRGDEYHGQAWAPVFMNDPGRGRKGGSQVT